MTPHAIKVWDLPTRLFHWLLFALVVAAIVSVKIGGNAMIWHGRFGHLIFGLIVFRIVWGFTGSTYARFGQFVRGPGTVIAYLKGRWSGVGHNPLGALSVLGLLGIIAFQASSGLFANDDVAFNGPLYRAVSSATSNQISGLHRQAEWFIYALVALHVLAVVYYTLVKKDDLVRPMITGTKIVSDATVAPAQGGGIGALVIAVAITVLALWVSSGGLLPEPPPPPPDLGW